MILVLAIIEYKINNIFVWILVTCQSSSSECRPPYMQLLNLTTALSFLCLQSSYIPECATQPIAKPTKWAISVSELAHSHHHLCLCLSVSLVTVGILARWRPQLLSFLVAETQLHLSHLLGCHHWSEADQTSWSGWRTHNSQHWSLWWELNVHMSTHFNKLLTDCLLSTNIIVAQTQS